jgi:hypothetical protein
MKFAPYSNTLQTSKHSGSMINFSMAILRRLFADKTGEIDADKQVDGDEFVEFAKATAYDLGIHPEKVECGHSLSELDHRKRSAILAGLRLLQDTNLHAIFEDVSSEMFSIEPLNAREIEELIEEINLGTAAEVVA